MTVLVARHGLSEANNQESLAFGSPNAHLMEKGRVQASGLGFTLRTIYKVDTKTVDVAASELVRTQETASEAGFEEERLVIYPLLNEATGGLHFAEIRDAIDRRQVPPIAIAAAEAILANPPQQRIWISHGFVIAGLCEVLGIRGGSFVPKFCELRELNI